LPRYVRSEPVESKVQHGYVIGFVAISIRMRQTGGPTFVIRKKYGKNTV
jgi:hypothetical protein